MLSDTQKVPFGLNATPQPFCRFGSVCAAAMLPSETSAVDVNGLAGGADGAGESFPPPHAARPAARALASAIANKGLQVFIIDFLIRCDACR
ncbi:hypothetical protein BCAR13_1270011 [Paraburkholderia caribensis]|nr:hypothetical protein BCAR13_1270011 [Paraburkholderia caribensis]